MGSSRVNTFREKSSASAADFGVFFAPQSRPTEPQTQGNVSGEPSLVANPPSTSGGHSPRDFESYKSKKARRGQTIRLTRPTLVSRVPSAARERHMSVTYTSGTLARRSMHQSVRLTCWMRCFFFSLPIDLVPYPWQRRRSYEEARYARRWLATGEATIMRRTLEKEKFLTGEKFQTEEKFLPAEKRRHHHHHHWIITIKD